MANHIKGNQDREGGGNDSYTIMGRGVVPRRKLVAEVEKGKHPNFSTYTKGRETFIRAKPDKRKDNNVNRD